jgi:glutathione S-transferase
MAAIIADGIGSASVKARLYTVPGSHPGVAVEAMLKRKGIAFDRTDLFPVMSRGLLRVLGFSGKHVPAMKIDGRRVQGSREISRELDLVQPEPPLFPADPEQRRAVEKAERFGDVELQQPVRQLVWWALRRNTAPLRSYSTGYNLGIPIGLAVRTAAPIVAMAVRINDASDENVRAGLERLPGLLDRVDAWIADGVIGGEEPNAADFQIAGSLRLAQTLHDLRPAIDSRPAGAMARRVIPDFPGDAPPIFPPEWLAPLRATAQPA